MHVRRRDVEVEAIQVDGRVHECLLRVPVGFWQEGVARTDLHGLGHLLPALHRAAFAEQQHSQLLSFTIVIPVLLPAKLAAQALQLKGLILPAT